MATVVTVMNMKGGVGKTTVAAHIGGMLATYLFGGKRRNVLLIDYDAQFNLSQAWLPTRTYVDLETRRKTTLSILVDDPTSLNPYHLQVPDNAVPPRVADLAHVVYHPTSWRGKLAIVPSTLDLMFVALAEPDQKTQVMEERFAKFIAAAREDFDVVIIDCHPAGSLFTKTALRNSDHVIIPVVPERYSIRGVGLMMRFIDEKKPSLRAPVPHILFNRMPRAGVASQERAIRGDSHYTAKCLNETMRLFKVFSDPEEGSGFAWYSGKPHSTRALQNLHNVTTEIVTRLNL